MGVAEGLRDLDVIGKDVTVEIFRERNFVVKRNFLIS